MDPTIGRLQAALASVTNEVTVAAANFNFDFSIVKYEAPKEFHPIGAILSPKRKYEAEDGSCHIIARRLAALFAGVCPKCPGLIKAYGKRASEIATKATNETSKEHFDSIFSQYTGVDATSMWAAATSSDDADGRAIHVHLLACLLASTWEAPEAISIWVQIIAERRKEIAQRIERGEEVDFATASAAAQQEIPRNQLAEWDASARSWLETADGTKKWEQKQLELILDNFEASVASQQTVYENVVKVWKTASTTMDNLVSGIAQEVQAGTMIGLKAWHLYPDMHVFGKKAIQVEMKDPLIAAGGVLSLMCSPSATTPKSGITWSLSLANLKFYGDPVQTTAHMQGESSRLTVEEFRVVLLGCILRAWNIAPKQESITIKLLAALSLTFLDQWREPEFQNTWKRKNAWHCNYADAFTLLEKAQAHHRHDELNSAKLINLGRNRPEFKPKEYTIKGSTFGSRPFFGLLNSSTFLKCLRSPDDKVGALRRCGSRIEKLRDCHAIIRYKTANNEFQYTTMNDDVGGDSTLWSAISPLRFTRWRDPDLTIRAESTTRFGNADGCDDKTSIRHDANIEDECEITRIVKSRNDDGSGCEDNLLHVAFGSMSMSLEDDGNDKDNEDDEGDDEDDDADDEDDEDNENDDGVEEKKSDHYDPTTLLFEFNGESYQFYFGSSDTASICVPVGYCDTCLPSFEPEDVWWALEHRKLTWDGHGFIATDSMIPWLSQFEYALRCLRGLPGPIISAQTLRKSSLDPKWVRDLKSSYSSTVAGYSTSWTRNPTTSEILSILVYFLGGCDISSSELHDSTTGISYGNSIYVPTELLRDPLEMKGKHGSITRVLGNVGLPGLVIFSSVDSPMIAPMDDAYYRVIDMNQFDGRPENHFDSTTMHLSFTKWERSLDMINSQGKQDVQFTRKESVISIRESGHWIGDFDVMAALRSPYIYASPPQEPCDCSQKEYKRGKPSLDSSLRSIETWNQLRECQSGLSVVRVHGNWLARLAVTAYLAQRANQNGGDGARITLLPAKVCWNCFEHKFSSNIYIY